MPTVNKQQPVKTTQQPALKNTSTIQPNHNSIPAKVLQTTNAHSKPSILDQIAPIGNRRSGIKLLEYGRGKTGKTRLACSFPKPLLLIGTEDGTLSLGKPEGGDWVRINNGYQLTDLTEMLETTDKYKTVILDTAGGYQDLILKDVLGLEDIPQSKFRKAGKGESWGITDRSTWGTIGTQFKERMHKLLRLSETKGMNVVIVAHERGFAEEGSSDVMVPTVGAALTPSAAGWLNGACDYIGQTFVREETETVETAVGTGPQAKKIKLNQKTGNVEYCLRVGPHPVYMTGFRLPPGFELPDVIVIPDTPASAGYDRILAIIEGKR